MGSLLIIQPRVLWRSFISTDLPDSVPDAKFTIEDLNKNGKVF
jgi:hypothetical protein